MLSMEEWFMIRELYAQGYSITAISDKTGYDWKTVKKHLNSTTIPEPKLRAKRESKLDQFKEYIIKRLNEAPLTASRLFQEIQEMGFTGKCTIVQDFIRKVRPGQGVQAVYRYETKPVVQLYPHQRQYFASEWILKLLQGEINNAELEVQFKGDLGAKDICTLIDCVLNKPIRYRNRAITILLHIKRISKCAIANALFLDPKTVQDYILRFEEGGVENLLDLSRKKIKKSDDQEYKDAVFSLLHAPPSCYGINRTTWKMEDIKYIMCKNGLPISRDNIRKIINDAGYQVRKAKKVLTSTDPNYREKLREITEILANLGPKEKFFSIDEFGPFAVKMQGGISLVLRGQAKIIPQFQKSKGSLIITGALELSTNQITHFYSEKKNTDEMIKLMEILVDTYKDEDRIFLSWDGASWHGSKKLYEAVEEINSLEYRMKHKVPIVKLAPLPSSAQFLNVIESVFSGMARAIIHNSDYQSVAECKNAIDRHFIERNQYFRENPKRAGNKIWGDELVEAKFSESSNCKNPAWQKY
jgi:transposase